MDSLANGSLLAAVSASAQISLANDDSCVREPDGGCAPKFPSLRVLTLLGGWGVQRGERGLALRALIGPALVRAERKRVFGVQSRADLSSAALRRVSFVGWVQLLLIPDLFGERARTQSFGIGLRVQ